MYFFIHVVELRTDTARAPTAGGQYYWVSMLAPISSKRFFSYATGELGIMYNGAESNEGQGGLRYGVGRQRLHQCTILPGLRSRG